MAGAVVVNGFWGQDNRQCCIINVYAPCPLSERAELWDRIQCIVDQNAGSYICICGDFNSIRKFEERCGTRAESGRRDVEIFDSFIRDTGLIDLPLHGRSYTWYKPDGLCKDRLDRILINSEWLVCWPSLHLRGLRRSLSDHCPIVLVNKPKDWGPKPFRCLNAWFSHPDFRNFVKERWSSYENAEVFGSLEKDTIDDVLGLEDHEVIRRNEVRAQLFSDLKCKDSLLRQKAQCRWIKDRDVNSSYFHRCINKRRKRNKIHGMLINGVWNEEVQSVKQGVFEFFRNHFKRKVECRPILSYEAFPMKVSENQNLMGAGLPWAWRKEWGMGGIRLFGKRGGRGSHVLKRVSQDFLTYALIKRLGFRSWVVGEKGNGCGNGVGDYPLSYGAQDEWKWRYSTTGVYETKKTYEQISQGDPNEAEDTEMDKVFEEIWSCLAPAKVMVHAWRVIWESLDGRLQVGWSGDGAGVKPVDQFATFQQFSMGEMGKENNG
ncbi:hypothetical protein ACS0TY_029134 [Phlomoides rotata]